MILFAISSTLSFMAQSDFSSKINNNLNQQSLFLSRQEEVNSEGILKIQCNISNDSDSPECYAYHQKQKAIASYTSTWSEYVKNYSESLQENNKTYETNNKWSIRLLWLGVLFSIFYAIIGIVIVFKCRKSRD